jgi:ribonuclease P protein component
MPNDKRDGVRFETDKFRINLREGKQQKRPRISIGKKVAPLAVDRNRIRRIFFEALRSLGKKNAQISVMVKKNLKDLKTTDIKNELRKLKL